MSNPRKLPTHLSKQQFRVFFATLLLFCLLPVRASAAPGDITTVAGDGNSAFGGDNGPATSASLKYPQAIALDSQGNLFITDLSNQRVRRVDAVSGVITTIAGTGSSGYNGDGIPATAAQLNYPDGVAVASNGDVYIADFTNQRVRRIDATTGLISTVAGTGVAGFDGDGTATAKQLRDPVHVSFDASGNLLIADVSNERIRRLDLMSGLIGTIAGTGTTGFNGDGIAATSADLNQPTGVVSDASGNFYFADLQNDRIRRVDAVSGLISTIAGDGTYATSGDGGPAAAAQVARPTSLCRDAAGNLFIAENGNHVIRRIDADTGIITTICGSAGNAGFSGDGGPAISAKVQDPYDLVFDAAGNLYFSDAGNNRIRRIEGVGELAQARLVLAKARPFPATKVGTTSRTQRVAVRNSGTATLQGLGLRVSGKHRRDFRVKGPSSRTVATGAATSFTASFRPKAKGRRSAVVNVTSSNGGIQKVTLKGKGK